MNRKAKNHTSLAAPRAHAPHLSDVLLALDRCEGLPATRLRDLRSSVRRISALIGHDPAQIQLDLATLSRRLAACMPAAAGLTEKSFANIKSDFLAAVKASGIKSVYRAGKTPMTASWSKLLADRSSKRTHLGLSRLAGWCSGKGIEPAQVSDTVLADFIDSVRQETLHRKPNELHRNVARIWNEAAQDRRLRLGQVVVPSFRSPAKRVEWSVLPASLQNDLEAYLDWCAGGDAFAVDARSRALAPQTVKLQKNHVHAAVTALVDSGISPKAIKSLGGLVTIENFKRILRRRHDMVGGRENVFNRDLTITLIEIARRWVKVSTARLEGSKGSPTKSLRLQPGSRARIKNAPSIR